MPEREPVQPRPSPEEGWFPLESVVAAFGRSVDDANAALGRAGEARWMVRDLHVDLVAEFYIDSDRGCTLVRLPLLARNCDRTFTDAHLSKLSWSLARLPAEMERDS
jgi:hypothetical protein